MKFHLLVCFCFVSMACLSQEDISSGTKEEVHVLVTLKNGQTIEGELKEFADKRISIIQLGKKKSINQTDISTLKMGDTKLVNFKDELYKVEISGKYLSLYSKEFAYEGERIKSGFEKWLLAKPYSQKTPRELLDEKNEMVLSQSSSSYNYFLQKGNSMGLYQIGSLETLKNCYLITDCPFVWESVQNGENELDIYTLVKNYNSCF